MVFNTEPSTSCIRLSCDNTAKKIWFILFTISFSVSSYGQFSDNFSDGDFINNPSWSSDVPTNWIIDNGRLRSNSSTASSSFYLSTSSTKATEAQWEFFTNLQFNTSSNNYVDVFLVSANENLLNGGNNGYFVRIGGTPDEISLYKISGGTSSIIINGTDGVTNSSNTNLKIKVTRDAASQWILSYDNTGLGNNYVDEPPVIDNTFTTGNFFGIRITQSTSTFFNKHFFDDFYVGDVITDDEPPIISSAIPQAANELSVLFSEKVERLSAETISNYQVNNSVGQPLSALLQPDEKTVRLVFSNSFPNAITSQLSVQNVQDLSGNAIVQATADFFYFQPQPVLYKDVIITEIFADPSPVIGLLDAEFIELFNRSTNPIDLQDWKFTDGSSTASLPTKILMPGAYLIITTTAASSAYTVFGPTLGVAGFPTLNNSGDKLTLLDASAKLVDEVSYTDGWYRDEDKKQGGWTLELIDPDNICAEEENWVAAEASAGGTPGKVNSVFAVKPDLTGPNLLSAIPTSPTQLKLVFDEKLQNSFPALSDFVISPAIGLSSVSFASAALREIIIDLSSAIQQGQTYTLTVSAIRDCSGNLIQESFNSVDFGLVEEAAPLDVVINEILFNPRPFGVDFVEVFNCSQKYINLKDWMIGNFENGGVTNAKPITASDYLLPPQSIRAFTIDPLTIQSHYPKSNQAALFKVNSLPSFPDDEGSVSIVNTQSALIDNFIYSRSYHSVFVKDKEGVSLERIFSDAPTNDKNNWKSAASTVDFASPGNVNSNAVAGSTSDGEVTIEPEIFIPLYSQPDFAEIRYSFQTGKVANVKILDHRGREIKQIANNETIATTGFYRWDGDRNDGTKASPGYYFVWFEVFDGSGKVETFRKRIVIAAR